MDESGLKKVLNRWDLVGLNIVAIVGLRWLLTSSAIGPSSIVLWLAAFAMFFIPQAFVVAELSSSWPQQGGIYAWTKLAMGDAHGFIAGWCYWTNSFIYFPTLLFFLARNAAWMWGGDLPQLYVTAASVALLWAVAGASILGLKTGRWFQNLGAAVTFIVAAMIIGFGLLSLNYHPPATEFSGFAPRGGMGTISFWSAMCFAFAGLELQSMMGGEIKNPKRSIPFAIVVAGLIVTVIYIAGTVALMLAVPNSEIDIIGGIPQAIASVASSANIRFSSSVVAALITVGGLGGVLAWFSGTARIPFVAGLDRKLPASMGKLHRKFGTPHVAIIAQASIVTALIIISSIGASLMEAYLTLVNATIVLCFIPYLYMFASALILRSKMPDVKREVKMPLGDFGAGFFPSLGFITVLLAILLVFVYPGVIENRLVYEAKLIGITGFFVVTGVLVYYREGIVKLIRRKSDNKS
ncbi:MAG: hypothetical protein CVT48_03060 [Thermoplasmata archaeon HGW-Thermoplasmata-1]|nr:MAG: hypothetical protein CVT48_03060 [Thermoplasmata archaeon HGW-Thermoplasmata-1]